MKKILILTLLGIQLASCSSFTQRDIAEAPPNAPERRYFIIQNVATERTRVYEKCEEDANKACLPGSKNRLIYETEMVVGGDDLRSDVGVQNIERWVKFYQDQNSPVRYPSWYDPNYPDTPKGGYAKWFKDSAMPNQVGDMRGAFGWYAAIMTPTTTGQWMHGTIGWGSDGDSFIKLAHGKGVTGFLGKLFSDMRSHGCTRHENQAIAYLQSLLPPGTALIKIYAKEALADATLSRYSAQKNPGEWEWILTKEDVRSSNPRSITASDVRARLDRGEITNDDILEAGIYKFDQHPDVVAINTKKGAESGKSGDSYKIFKKEVPQGLFLIDEGVVTTDYRHPSDIEKDGIRIFNPNKSEFKGQLVPNYALQPTLTSSN